MSEAVTTRRPEGDAPTDSASAGWKPTSPFVDRLDPHDDSRPPPTRPPLGGATTAAESPFLSVYESADDGMPSSNRTSAAEKERLVLAHGCHQGSETIPLIKRQ